MRVRGTVPGELSSVVRPASIIFIMEAWVVFVCVVIIVPFIVPCIVPIIIPVVIPIDVLYIDIGVSIPIISIMTHPITIPPHKPHHEESQVNASILSLICASNIDLLALRIIRKHLLAHVSISIDNDRIDLAGSGCDICSPLDVDDVSIQMH